jgi:hypothetical protein
MLARFSGRGTEAGRRERQVRRRAIGLTPENENGSCPANKLGKRHVNLLKFREIKTEVNLRKPERIYRLIYSLLRRPNLNRVRLDSG